VQNKGRINRKLSLSEKLRAAKGGTGGLRAPYVSSAGEKTPPEEPAEALPARPFSGRAEGGFSREMDIPGISDAGHVKEDKAAKGRTSSFRADPEPVNPVNTNVRIEKEPEVIVVNEEDEEEIASFEEPVLNEKRRRAKERKRGHLLTKFLAIFLFISLVPLGVVSYYFLTRSQQTLNQAISRDQEALAIGFADTVSSYIVNFRNVLFAASKLQDFASMDPVRQTNIITQVMQLHPAFLEMSIINGSGQETVRRSIYVKNQPFRDFSDDPILKKVIRSPTGDYVGGMEKYLGSTPVITLAVTIRNPDNQKVVGVLISKVSLTSLSDLLQAAFPAESKTVATIIDTNGFLIAHSDPKQMYRPNPKLPDDVLQILLQGDAKTGSGEIDLSEGRVLSAFAEVENLGWVVYIQRSVAEAYKSSVEMLKKTVRVIVVAVFFVIFLGYAFSVIITQPIVALREAAVKLGEGNLEEVPELPYTNDEIGELTRSFIKMSESIKGKQEEILNGKEALEKANRSLEQRVEARTRELKSAQDELINKERLAAIGQMASVVGHEIRNPLAVINNSTYFIKMKLNAMGAVTPTDPKIMKHVGIIESEIRQANGIIDEILGFARTRELHLCDIPVNAYINELAASYPIPSHVELVKQLTKINPSVSIDKDEMTQVFRNLIKNAVEVMPEKGQIIIRSDYDAGDNTVSVEVSDSGPGIPQDKLDKIFTPFFTTKPRGTGLGLAVVKKVVERHKGRIEVSSALGRGTTFRIHLPAVKKA